jgi:hypothetical protein
MAEKKQYEFFVLRYVPNAVRNDSVTFGIVMYEPSNSGGFSEVRLTKDWRQVRCFDPNVAVEELEALGRSLALELQAPEQGIFLKKLGESFSNQVQVSQVKGLLTENALKELEILEKYYLEVRHSRSAKRELTGRPWLVGQMKDILEQAGILGMMYQGFSIAPFTKNGDPMKMDFAYPAAGEIKFLQAVSLRAGVDQAVMLAARFEEIAAAITAKEKAKARLTAVVEDDLDRTNEAIGFALAMMQEKGLQVERVGEMPRIAQEIRMELEA